MNRKLTPERLKAAKAALKKHPPNFADLDALVFVLADGTAFQVNEKTTFAAGQVGWFAKEPIVYAIHVEISEDRHGNDVESVDVEPYEHYADLPEDEDWDAVVGALVYQPSDDGELNRVPIVLESRKAIRDFMNKWGLMGG